MYNSYMDQQNCNMTYINLKGEKISVDFMNVSRLLECIELIHSLNRIIINLRIGDTQFDVIERDAQITLIPIKLKEAYKA